MTKVKSVSNNSGNNNTSGMSDGWLKEIREEKLCRETLRKKKKQKC